VLVLVAVAAVVVVAQIRPQISETFEGEGYTHITTANETVWGIGHWAIDEPAGRSIERWEFVIEHRHRNVHYLKRFDLGFEYTMHFERSPRPHEVCAKRAVTPPMPPNWAWLKDARYQGKHVIDGTSYDIWRHNIANVELEVAVSEHDASRPVYFFRRAPEEHRMYHFLSFHTFKPNATWFDVPTVCKNVTEESLVPVDGDDNEVAGSIIAAEAVRIVEQSPAYDAASMIVAATRHARVCAPTGLWAQQADGSPCIGGPIVGDVFFDGVPAVSAAVYLGANKFAECPAVMGSKCAIVDFRPFSGGCRRYP